MSVQHRVPIVPESAWFKSSYSGGGGGECVEVAAAPGTVHVRDSKRLGGPVVTVGREAWAGFVGLASGSQA
ncbi:hypothetical protein AMK26_15610 [Streptomyces sp. CB03234]|uniref:DUF397 domain-containing protein n=1 Tax=Streptomyces sp. (strain CB03234) TaxID=1703937 RepID=UPI00093F2DB0|nr:DUF397 domain-containing protein [Streptomyces sp. CB03234]OKK04729.1 hypothetical protein AMK26_15610 [Streptomyces sp. CB03234]